MNEEFSCRICRGEATESQPLLHPCKCKGSIRYIHQDCLLEWLKHSNKSSEQCDICHTTYQFQTIYDSATPRMVPVRLIGAKVWRLATTAIQKSTATLLFISCLGFLVPVTWKLIGRIVNLVIDGGLPEANPAFIEAILFGEFDINAHIQRRLLSDPSISVLLEKTNVFIQYTYMSGLRYICASVILWIVLFLEREWVTRDEVYTRMLLRRIGKERKPTLMDLLNKQAHPENHRDEEHDLPPLANPVNPAVVRENLHLMENLQDVQQDVVDTMQFLQDGNIGFGNNRLILNRFDRDAAIEDFFGRNQDQDESDQELESENEQDVERLDDEFEDLLERLNGQQAIRLEPPVLNAEEAAQAAAQDARAAQAAEELVDINERANINNNNNNNNNNNENGWFAELLALWGLEMSIKAPLLLMLFADMFILVFILVAYFFPHIIGKVSATILGYVLKWTYQVSSKSLSLLFSRLTNIAAQFSVPSKTGVEFIDIFGRTIYQYVIRPSYNTYFNVFLGPSPQTYSLVERIMFVGIGYTVVFGFLHQIMKNIISRGKPVVGSLRYYYSILFELFSTLKVFVIFSIEIVLFPVYCGWLLDFCAGPVLLQKFTEQVLISGETYTTFLPLFTSHYEALQQSYVRTLIYWLAGTFYMFCLSLFVGMTRSKILRPGVLFFIRSPDDPDTKLIREAMVKPLTWQLSRIYLSGKFYSLFIIVGLGGVSWGIRYVVAANNVNYNVFLPLQMPPAAAYAPMVLFTVLAAKYDALAKYGQLYWRKAFELSAHRLRLSHFILGKPITQERGRIVYRNVLHQFLGIAVPDYTNPVSYREALTIFQEHPEVAACFVPDGSFVRAPDSDSSRRFVKHVFVAVTKDDQLIAQPPVQETLLQDEHGEYSDEDDDVDQSENGHAVVYRPPGFKKRCVGLIVLLWVFGTLLFLSLFCASALLGRPVVLASCIAFGQTFDSKLLDYGTLHVGFCIISISLNEYDRRVMLQASLEEAARVQAQREQEQQEAAQQENARFENLPEQRNPVNDVDVAVNEVVGAARNPAAVAAAIANSGRRRNQQMFMLAIPLWTLWVMLAHVGGSICLDYAFGMTNPNEIHFAAAHLALMPWTVTPVFRYLMFASNRRIDQGGVIRDDSGLFEVLTRLAIFSALSSVYAYLSLVYSFDIWSSLALAFSTYIVGDSIRASIHCYNWLNEVVKNEVYARKRSLVNVD